MIKYIYIYLSTKEMRSLFYCCYLLTYNLPIFVVTLEYMTIYMELTYGLEKLKHISLLWCVLQFRIVVIGLEKNFETTV